ncbi:MULTISPECIES: DoxX family protein [unclassified Streptomyces]|uniref:DoxX family protein n=1 Tax=unclassified Streptomyces TaxID=2593676 RepID=UPI002E349885|nr:MULTISPECIES: DoxX family membrane protein [unclassified Streptomyces]WUC67673.1 DoxX family membrane protein [Streptomyces sp. NBC_00539]
MTSASAAATKAPAAAPAAPAPTTATSAHDAGLLLLRVVLGLTMAAHGTQKLFGWFGGGGISGTGRFFTASGYPAGDSMAALAGLTETLGGLGLAAGLLTPLAGAAVVGTMINAIAVHGAGAFFAPEGIEYELLLTAGAAALALAGPGRYAADRLLPVPALRTPRPAHRALALALGVVMGAALLLVRN